MKKILLLGSCAFLLAACGNEGNTKTTENATEETTEQVSSSDQTSMADSAVTSESILETPLHSINEPVSLYLDNPDEIVAEVVVTKATDNIDAFPDYLKSGDYFDVNSLILIQVDYTNISYPENFSMGLHDFQVFTEDGKNLPNIGQQNGGDAVAQGRTGSSEFYVESEGSQDKIELDFIPSGSSSPLATYTVDVEH